MIVSRPVYYSGSGIFASPVIGLAAILRDPRPTVLADALWASCKFAGARLADGAGAM